MYTLQNEYVQFGPGLCFNPEYREGIARNPGSSSEKGSGLTMVRQVPRKERAQPWFGRFGERNGLNPGSAGSEFGERNGPNPGLAGSEFGEKAGLNPGSEGSEKGMGQTLVRSWEKEPG